ncbi:MAG: precorrin-6A/cobalt-precorrin-6A reductase, partial [Pseudomonadota bacterium]
MAEKILILGGTKEASQLASELVAIHGNEAVISSLAGRTKEPKPVAGQVRIGGFGGVEGLTSFLIAEGISEVIDATHPFAQQISANAVEACRQAGIALNVRTRQPWKKQPNDIWIEVENLEEARQQIPENAVVLLAIGAQHLGAFQDLTHATLVARTVDGPSSEQKNMVNAWIVGRPSTDVDEEAQLLKEHHITHIVCRNSGGKGAYAQFAGGRYLG